MNKSLLAVPVLCGLLACGKHADLELGTGTAPDPAAVNALVPASLKDKLTFEKQDITTKLGKHSTTYTVAWPKDWKRGDMDMFASYDAPYTLGHNTRGKLAGNCDGECKKKDWAKVTDDLMGQYSKGATVVKDVKGNHNRLLVVTSNSAGQDETEVVFAWWNDDATQSFYCDVSLAPEAKDAQAAFEKACQAVAVKAD